MKMVYSSFKRLAAKELTETDLSQLKESPHLKKENSEMYKGNVLYAAAGNYFRSAVSP